MAISPAPTDAAVFDRASERAIATLRANNVEVVVVDTGAQARDAVLERVPDGSEVLVGKSKTLEDIGVIDALLEEGRFDFVRSRLRAMDRATEGREMRKLGAAPDIEIGSVAALTEDGALVAASATGNQLGAYLAGAGRLILVVGSQKPCRTSRRPWPGSVTTSSRGERPAQRADGRRHQAQRRSPSCWASGCPAGRP